ncbi:cation:proton antiporter [Clostridium bovifaecis]|uniref:Cation:proton antiporter n=1 Tax=Clostridium bovifaecis TaxID=2184719 RepID=A0A6I6FFC7_9CLOT|nr:cation:proton antiporter [Clostridium bovifaecis]
MRIVLSGIFISGGLFFFMVGTVGLLRFPDMFTRAHSAAKCDTLGAMLSLIALVIYNGLNIVSLKLMLIILFIWLTNPTATHLIAKARYEQEVNNNEDI